MKNIKSIVLFYILSLSNISISLTQSEIPNTHTLDSLALQLLDPNINDKLNLTEELLAGIRSFASNYDFLEKEEPKFTVIHFIFSPDSSICIWSGLIRLPMDKNSYFGGIWHIPKRKWYELTHLPASLDYFETDFSGIDDWYGAVYYGIHAFEHKGSNKYVLFGFRDEDLITNTKLADILFIENNELKFGLPVFLDNTKNKIFNRFKLSYAAEAPIKLNYDPLENRIVFDHLIPMKHLYIKDRIVMVQDGSYNAYEYDVQNGYWYFIDKMEIVPADTAPRQQPILDSRKNLDIFGRPTKNNDGNRKPSN
jgi:hypothetical protein